MNFVNTLKGFLGVSMSELRNWVIFLVYTHKYTFLVLLVIFSMEECTYLV